HVRRAPGDHRVLGPLPRGGRRPLPLRAGRAVRRPARSPPGPAEPGTRRSPRAAGHRRPDRAGGPGGGRGGGAADHGAAVRPGGAGARPAAAVVLLAPLITARRAGWLRWADD